MAMAFKPICEAAKKFAEFSCKENNIENNKKIKATLEYEQFHSSDEWKKLSKLYKKLKMIRNSLAHAIDIGYKSSIDNLNYVKTLVHFHNNFLEILTQFGIIGFSIFLYMIVAISRIKIENPTIRILKISTISIFVLGSFTDMLFYLNDTMCLFAFIVGVILSQYKFENEIHIKN